MIKKFVSFWKRKFVDLNEKITSCLFALQQRQQEYDELAYKAKQTIK